MLFLQQPLTILTIAYVPMDEIQEACGMHFQF